MRDRVCAIPRAVFLFLPTVIAQATVERLLVQQSFRAANPARLLRDVSVRSRRRRYEASRQLLEASLMSLKVERDSLVAVRSFNLIIFDLDGVIIDSTHDLVSAAQYTLGRVGSSDPGFSFLRNCIGGGARNLLLHSLDEDKKDRVEDALTIFREYYERNCVNATRLYPGVKDVLTFYSGHKSLAVATFKIRAATQRILAELGVLHLFNAIVTADDVQRPKPDPQCVESILQSLRCSAEETILIGDTPTDVQTAKNAGICSCAVLYGIGTHEDLYAAKPDFVIENLLELTSIVVT
jgi:phosphoglycolate phosphatase